MPNTYERLLEETLKQKVSEAAEQLMKSTSQEIDAESQRDMIGARIYYENREAGERWLRMESQKPASSERDRQPLQCRPLGFPGVSTRSGRMAQEAREGHSTMDPRDGKVAGYETVCSSRPDLVIKGSFQDLR